MLGAELCTGGRIQVVHLYPCHSMTRRDQLHKQVNNVSSRMIRKEKRIAYLIPYC